MSGRKAVWLLLWTLVSWRDCGFGRFYPTLIESSFWDPAGISYDSGCSDDVPLNYGGVTYIHLAGYETIL